MRREHWGGGTELTMATKGLPRGPPHPHSCCSSPIPCPVPAVCYSSSHPPPMDIASHEACAWGTTEGSPPPPPLWSPQLKVSLLLCTHPLQHSVDEDADDAHAPSVQRQSPEGPLVLRHEAEGDIRDLRCRRL